LVGNVLLAIPAVANYLRVWRCIMGKFLQKSTLPTDDWWDLVRRDKEREFGEEGMAPLFRWFAENLRLVHGIVKGHVRLQLKPSHTRALHLIPFWCEKIVADVEPTRFDVRKLKYVSIIDPPRNAIACHEVCGANQERGTVLGLSDAAKMLRQKKRIRKSARGKKIIFSGTIMEAHKGKSHYVAFLEYKDSDWKLNFGWVKSESRAPYSYGWNNDYVFPLVV